MSQTPKSEKDSNTDSDHPIPKASGSLDDFLTASEGPSLFEIVEILLSTDDDTIPREKIKGIDKATETSVPSLTNWHTLETGFSQQKFATQEAGAIHEENVQDINETKVTLQSEDGPGNVSIQVNPTQPLTSETFISPKSTDEERTSQLPVTVTLNVYNDDGQSTDLTISVPVIADAKSHSQCYRSALPVLQTINEAVNDDTLRLIKLQLKEKVIELQKNFVSQKSESQPLLQAQPTEQQHLVTLATIAQPLEQVQPLTQQYIVSQQTAPQLLIQDSVSNPPLDLRQASSILSSHASYLTPSDEITSFPTDITQTQSLPKPLTQSQTFPPDLGEAEAVNLALLQHQEFLKLVAQQQLFSASLLQQQALASSLAQQNSFTPHLAQQPAPPSCLPQQQAFASCLAQQQAIPSTSAEQQAFTAFLAQQALASTLNEQQTGYTALVQEKTLTEHVQTSCPPIQETSTTLQQTSSPPIQQTSTPLQQTSRPAQHISYLNLQDSATSALLEQPLDKSPPNVSIKEFCEILKPIYCPEENYLFFKVTVSDIETFLKDNKERNTQISSVNKERNTQISNKANTETISTKESNTNRDSKTTDKSIIKSNGGEILTPNSNIENIDKDKQVSAKPDHCQARDQELISNNKWEAIQSRSNSIQTEISCNVESHKINAVETKVKSRDQDPTKFTIYQGNDQILLTSNQWEAIQSRSHSIQAEISRNVEPPKKNVFNSKEIIKDQGPVLQNIDLHSKNPEGSNDCQAKDQVSLTFDQWESIQSRLHSIQTDVLCDVESPKINTVNAKEITKERSQALLNVGVDKEDPAKISLCKAEDQVLLTLNQWEAIQSRSHSLQTEVSYDVPPEKTKAFDRRESIQGQGQEEYESDQRKSLNLTEFLDAKKLIAQTECTALDQTINRTRDDEVIDKKSTQNSRVKQTFDSYLAENTVCNIPVASQQVRQKKTGQAQELPEPDIKASVIQSLPYHTSITDISATKLKSVNLTADTVTVTANTVHLSALNASGVWPNELDFKRPHPEQCEQGERYETCAVRLHNSLEDFKIRLEQERSYFQGQHTLKGQIKGEHRSKKNNWGANTAHYSSVKEIEFEENLQNAFGHSDIESSRGERRSFERQSTDTGLSSLNTIVEVSNERLATQSRNSVTMDMLDKVNQEVPANEPPNTDIPFLNDITPDLNEASNTGRRSIKDIISETEDPNTDRKSVRDITPELNETSAAKRSLREETSTGGNIVTGDTASEFKTSENAQRTSVAGMKMFFETKLPMVNQQQAQTPSEKVLKQEPETVRLEKVNNTEQRTSLNPETLALIAKQPKVSTTASSRPPKAFIDQVNNEKDAKEIESAKNQSDGKQVNFEVIKSLPGGAEWIQPKSAVNQQDRTEIKPTPTQQDTEKCKQRAQSPTCEELYCQCCAKKRKTVSGQDQSRLEGQVNNASQDRKSSYNSCCKSQTNPYNCTSSVAQTRQACDCYQICCAAPSNDVCRQYQEKPSIETKAYCRCCSCRQGACNEVSDDTCTEAYSDRDCSSPPPRKQCFTTKLDANFTSLRICFKSNGQIHVCSEDCTCKEATSTDCLDTSIAMSSEVSIEASYTIDESSSSEDNKLKKQCKKVMFSSRCATPENNSSDEPVTEGESKV